VGSPVPVSGAWPVEPVEKYEVIVPEGAEVVYLRLYSLDIFDGFSWRVGLPITVEELKVSPLKGAPEIYQDRVIVYTGPGDVPTVVVDGVEYDEVESVYVLRGRLDSVEVLSFGGLDRSYRIRGDGYYAVVFRVGEPSSPRYVGYLQVPPGVRVDELLSRFPVSNLSELQSIFKSSFRYKWGVEVAGDPLDFLLKHGEGQCTIFATAFALAARRLGYPSRLVVGYTAERIAERKYVSYMPHVWVEAWLNNSWTTYDPTPGSTTMQLAVRTNGGGGGFDLVHVDVSPREVLSGGRINVTVRLSGEVWVSEGSMLCVLVELGDSASTGCTTMGEYRTSIEVRGSAGEGNVLVKWRLVRNNSVVTSGEHNDIPLEGTYSTSVTILEEVRVRVVKLLPELEVEVTDLEGNPLNATLRFNDMLVNTVGGKASCRCLGITKVIVEKPYVAPTISVLVLPSWILMLFSAIISLVGLLLYDYAHVVALYLISLSLLPITRRFLGRSTTAREYFDMVFERLGKVRMLERFLEWYERRSYS